MRSTVDVSKQPLNGIVGMAEVLLETQLDRPLREYASTIRTSADGLLTVINDILEYSWIEAGKLSIESARFDLGQALEEMIDLLAPGAHQKGLQVACWLPVDLPPGLIGDANRIRQVLLNLAGNVVSSPRWAR